MEDFIDKYCNCQTDNKARHILEDHINEVLIKTLRPAFNKQIEDHPFLSKRPKAKYASATDTAFEENPQWKTSCYLGIISWITSEISSQQLEQNFHLLVPPVLIVLDDYDIENKEKGVKMIHTIIKKLDPVFISRSGIDNVFLESLFKCLTYLSQDRDVPLLTVAYPCILDLISLSKKGKTQTDLFERVLKDGILVGFSYSGQKILFVPILLKPISTLYNELEIVGIQYLKAIVPTLCEWISMTPSANNKIKEINQLAMEALIVVIKKCWPRIPAYKGEIMKAIAKSWSYYFEAEDTVMCETLRQAYQVFEAACQGQEKANKEALLAYKPDIFGPLFA